MKAGVGDQLTIKGRNFLLGKKRNTVFFKAGSKPAVSARAEQSTRTTMRVVIPKALEQYLTVKDGVAQPTKVRLRILSKRFAKSFTALRLSPTISLGNASSAAGGGTGPGADCDGDGVVNSLDADDDNDLLSDTLDIALKLNPCSADSDADGMTDGFEYQSALDLNSTGGALPYPGRRPYPNPLDGTDGNSDYDGDGLTGNQEHLLWKAFGDKTLVLNYSAGMRATVAGQPNDGERDGDADLLTNWTEFNGPMQPKWWEKIFSKEKPYSEPYDGTNAIDPDSDGDGLVDGMDDTDHDGWLNVEEVSRTTPVTHDGVTSLYRVQPFNPCLPDWATSPTCSVHPPPATEAYPPFDSSPLPPSPIVWVP